MQVNGKEVAGLAAIWKEDKKPKLNIVFEYLDKLISSSKTKKGNLNNKLQKRDENIEIRDMSKPFVLALSGRDIGLKEVIPTDFIKEKYGAEALGKFQEILTEKMQEAGLTEKDLRFIFADKELLALIEDLDGKQRLGHGIELNEESQISQIFVHPEYMSEIGAKLKMNPETSNLELKEYQRSHYEYSTTEADTLNYPSMKTLNTLARAYPFELDELIDTFNARIKADINMYNLPVNPNDYFLDKEMIENSPVMKQYLNMPEGQGYKVFHTKDLENDKLAKILRINDAIFIGANLAVLINSNTGFDKSRPIERLNITGERKNLELLEMIARDPLAGLKMFDTLNRRLNQFGFTSHAPVREIGLNTPDDELEYAQAVTSKILQDPNSLNTLLEIKENKDPTPVMRNYAMFI